MPVSDWLLVDGSSLIFRAFYGVPRSIVAPDGRPVNAIRGFLDMLGRVVTERQPAALAIASDEDWRPQWRVDLVPSYKAHRTAEPVPPELEPQMEALKEVLAAIGVDFQGVAEFEAEDVIATWARLAEEKAPGAKVEVLSGDRDLFSLVREGRLRVLFPERAGLAVVDEVELMRRYGVGGELYADFALLRGDPSDGLPGVAGVGERRARDMVQRWGRVEQMLEAGQLGEVAAEYLRRAALVVRPRADAPIGLPLGSRSSYPERPDQVTGLQEQLGIQGPVGRLLKALSSRPLTKA